MTIISLTDGETTIALNDITSVAVTSYPMQSPAPNTSARNGVADGAALSAPVFGNVTETLTLLVRGTNPAEARTTLNDIERLLDRARQRVLGHGAKRCYIQVQFAGETDVWRSEILAGQLTVTDPGGDVWRNNIECEMVITRAFFWEGPETALHMSSQATSETTSPVTWHNGGDDVSGQRNFINIAANRVAGVLPTPLRLRLVLTGASQTIEDIWIGNTVWMDPANLDPIQMRSEATPNASVSWTTNDWFTVYSWVIDTATQNRIAGQMIRPLVAWSTRPNTATLQVGQMLALSTPIWSNEIFARTTLTSVSDFGAMPLPPGGASLQSSDLTFRVRMRRTGGDTVNAHSLHLMPSGDGVLRHLQPSGSGAIVLPTNGVIEDNGLDGVVSVTVSSNTTAAMRGYHAPICVWPNRVNRLRVLVAADPWAASIAWTAQAWYRPRRLSI